MNTKISIKRVLLGTVVGSVLLGVVTLKAYSMFLGNAMVAAYNYEDIFLGGVLMYRPEGTEGLKIFDLSKSHVTVIQYPWPLDCATIVISSPDGQIKGPCVKNIMPQVEELAKQDRINSI